ncbi:MAG: Bug family tripartite tricarboxylate transporter substrate binding protein, partial [Burkholderiales bacterium]
MRSLLVFSAALLGTTISAGVAAQAYPTKPVRLIVPFAPGGGTDLIGRVTAQKLTEAMKQTFIVDNRPGAGSTLGSELGAKAPPDGYTLTVIAGSYGVNP